MTLSTPLLATAPLLLGLLGPALLGANLGARQAAPPVAAVGRVGPATATGPVTASRTGPVPPPARAATAGRVRVVEHVAARTSAEERRVLGYWTPERMANALPISLLDLVRDGTGLVGGLTGRLGLTPAAAAAPAPPAAEAAPPRERARAATKLPLPRPQTAARPKANTIGARWGAGGAVARTTGRVFMTVGGADFVCSASTVKSANRDVVITAGHCVKDGTGEWAANWTFVPGYGTDGAEPYGRYAARRMFVADPWSRRGDDDYDIAMVALATSGGRHVADVAGAQQIAFNAPRGGQAFGFGYPADPPYHGGHLVYCAGRLRNDPYGQTHDQGLGCGMTAGSSGGPWLTGFDPATGKGTIVSLSSFKYSDDPRTMYGPYLGAAARSLFNAAQRA